MESNETHTFASGLQRLTVGGLLAVLGMAFLVFPNAAAKYTGYNAINSYSMSLADDALKINGEAFLALSGIKTSLAIIEGSEVGVGLELEIGDLVQAPYDYVDFFWHLFLYALLILGAFKLLIETKLLALGLGLMGVGMILLAASSLSQLPTSLLRRWGRRAVLSGALFAYTVPVALITTHGLSERYTAAIKEKHLQAMYSLNLHIDESTENFLELKEQINLLQPGTTIENLKNGMYTIAQSVGRTFQQSLSAFLYFMLVIAFEVVLFPFLSAFMLYKFGQFALGRAIPVAAEAPERTAMASA